jgi:hypothetical protein
MCPAVRPFDQDGPPQPNKGRTAGHIFGREPSNDYFIKILFLLSKWFQTRRFLWEFPIGFYVKLSSAVVTKNMIFFKWPKLLYFKPECAQI